MAEEVVLGIVEGQELTTTNCDYSTGELMHSLH